MKDFLDIVIDNIKVNKSCYTEAMTQDVKKAMEMQYHPEIIRNYAIEKIFCIPDGFGIKWHKRIFSLTDGELESRYGEWWLKSAQNGK